MPTKKTSVVFGIGDWHNQDQTRPRDNRGPLGRMLGVERGKGCTYTDEHKSYAGPENRETANRGNGEYVRGDVYINGTEPVRGLARRAYSGSYRHTADMHLRRCINEFTEAEHKDVGCSGQDAPDGQGFGGQAAHIQTACGPRCAVLPATILEIRPRRHTAIWRGCH